MSAVTSVTQHDRDNITPVTQHYKAEITSVTQHDKDNITPVTPNFLKTF